MPHFQAAYLLLDFPSLFCWLFVLLLFHCQCWCYFFISGFIACLTLLPLVHLDWPGSHWPQLPHWPHGVDLISPSAHILSLSLLHRCPCAYTHYAWLFSSRVGYLVMLSAISCMNTKPQITEEHLRCQENIDTLDNQMILPILPFGVGGGRVRSWLHFTSHSIPSFSISLFASAYIWRDSMDCSTNRKNG